jgi:glutamate-1-semialdehyde 2,1-aminomutase
MANGFSVSALAGKREFMRLGGLEQTDFPRVFLLSTTHGAETHALAAAIATMKIYRNEPVIEHLYRQGERLAGGLNDVIRQRKLEEFFRVAGRANCLFYAALDQHGKPSQEFRTLMLQETIRRGILAPSLVVSYSHTDSDIDQTIEAFDGALKVYGMAIEDGVDRYLVGRPSKVVYRKFNDRPPPHPHQDTGATAITQKAS